MASHDPGLEDGGFVPFFRAYTKTWIHAVATAGLTAFGTLTIVHNWFVALALASYVVPPILLYLRRPGRVSRTGPGSVPGAGEPERAVDSPDSRRTEGVGDGGREDGTDAREADDAHGGADDANEWHAVDAPTAATLHDVTVTNSSAVAVGAGGVVLTVAGDGEWSVLLEDGPAAGANDLHGVDATDDGDAVWTAGDSGSLGRVDLETGRHTDYTAPRDVTDNWLGVAVGGEDGEETILLITGSGGVYRGRYRDGEIGWDDPLTPGSGSSLSAVAIGDGVGYCCDTDDGVFETTDGGESFERVGLDADGTLTDVATANGGCLVSADDGVVHRYDGPAWTPERVADDAVTGLDCHGERAVACTTTGIVLERDGPAAEWDRVASGSAGGLHAVSIGPERSIAVGEDGNIVQRR